MRLKITTPETYRESFLKGWVASVFLDDVDVSKYTSRVVLTVEADDVIRADMRFYLTGADVELPAEIKAVLSEDQSSEVMGERNVQKAALSAEG